MNIIIALTAFLAVSLFLNAYLFLALKKKKAERAGSVELREFIGDLLTGAGLLKISRVDPKDIYLRSPRNIG